MAKCLNCTNEAIWLVETKGAHTQVFCDLDLPWFLRKAAQEGTLPRLEAKKSEVKTEVKKEEVKPVVKSDSSED